MQAALIVSFLANLVLSLVSLAILPETVAIHFGSGGAPDGWASSAASTLLMLGMNTFLFCSLYFSPKLVEKAPSKWISLPNRDYWLTPERRPRAVAMLSESMWQFGTLFFLFMFFVGLLSLRANLSNPVRLNETALLTALVIFLGYTLYWTVALVQVFRLPKKE